METRIQAASPRRRKAAPPKKKPASRAAAPRTKSAKPSATDRRRKVIITALEDLKGEDIVTLNVREVCSFADYMIVASGRGPRHVASLADAVIEALGKAGFRGTAEGQETGDWVLIDAGDIVVHLFRPEIREHYHLEKMWSV